MENNNVIEKVEEILKENKVITQLLKEKYHYHCESCDYTCSDKPNEVRHNATDRHLRKVAGISTRRTYHCPDPACKYKSPLGANVTRHIRRHVKPMMKGLFVNSVVLHKRIEHEEAKPDPDQKAIADMTSNIALNGELLRKLNIEGGWQEIMEFQNTHINFHKNE
jgi:hypothetical protein